MGGVEHFGNVPLLGQRHVFSVEWLSFLIRGIRKLSGRGSRGGLNYQKFLFSASKIPLATGQSPATLNRPSDRLRDVVSRAISPVLLCIGAE